MERGIEKREGGKATPKMIRAVIESLKIELSWSAKSPLSPLFQRGEIPPFEKGG